jgi:hypothetical protein
MMKWWKRSLALSLGLLVTGARAGDNPWRPSPQGSPSATQVSAVQLDRPVAPAVTAPAVTLGQPVASLGRPVPLPAYSSRNQIADPQVLRTSFVGPDGGLVIRGSSPDAVARPLPMGPETSDKSNRMFSWQQAGIDDVPAPRPELIPAPKTAGTPFVIPSDRPVISTPGTPIISSTPGATPAPVPFPRGDGVVVGQMFGGDPCECDPCCDECCCNACPTCCPCEEGRCYPGNRCYVKGEYLLWFTKGDPLPPLVTTGPLTDPVPGSLTSPNTAILYGNNSVGGNWRSGARLMAGYWFDDDRCIGIEAGGFFLVPRDNNFAANSPTGSPALARPILGLLPPASVEAVANIGVPGRPDLGGGIAVSHHSTLWGAEANLRSNLLCGEDFFFDGLVGFRTLRLSEELSISESPMILNDFVPAPGQLILAGSTTLLNDDFKTRNQFYGGQIGGIFEIRRNRFSVDVTTKLGMGANQQTVIIGGAQLQTIPARAGVFAGGSQFFPVGELAAISNSGTFHRSVFSLLPEAGINLGYQLTDHIRAFVGYDFLYWTNVVRPGPSVDLTVNRTQNPMFGAPLPPVGNPAAPAFVFHDSNYWAQGLHVGIEFRY